MEKPTTLEPTASTWERLEGFARQQVQRLYVKAGLEDTSAALLVRVGVLSNGQEVLLAVESA